MAPGALAVVAGAEPVAHLVVEVGLAQHRQAHQEVAGGNLLAGGHHLAGLDPVDQQREVEPTEVVAHRLGGGGAQQVGEDLALAALLAGLELDLAAEHVDGGLEVDDPGHRLRPRPAGSRGAGRTRRSVSAPAIANRALTPERWSTELDSRRLRVKRARISTRWSGHLGDQLGLLPDHRDLVLELGRVVGPDLGAEAVLERGDDAAAVGVVLGVGAGHHEGVERQAQDVAADLDVALLHHVQHRDLDPLGEVGQLVDRDDAAVAARDQPEVDGLGVAEVTALGHLHRVDVADQVGDRGVRGGELLGVPLVTVAPLDRQLVAELVGAAPRLGRDRARRGARRARRRRSPASTRRGGRPGSAAGGSCPGRARRGVRRRARRAGPARAGG